MSKKLLDLTVFWKNPTARLKNPDVVVTTSSSCCLFSSIFVGMVERRAYKRARHEGSSKLSWNFTIKTTTCKSGGNTRVNAEIQLYHLCSSLNQTRKTFLEWSWKKDKGENGMILHIIVSTLLMTTTTSKAVGLFEIALTLMSWICKMGEDIIKRTCAQITKGGNCEGTQHGYNMIADSFRATDFPS